MFFVTSNSRKKSLEFQNIISQTWFIHMNSHISMRTPLKCIKPIIMGYILCSTGPKHKAGVPFG